MRQTLAAKTPFAPPIYLTVYLTIVAFQLTGISAAETVTLTDIDGVKTTGTLESWLSDKPVIEVSSPDGKELAEIRSIVFDRTSKNERTAGSSVWLSCGDRISAKTISVTDDRLTISWPLLGTTTLPSISLEKVVAVIFDAPPTASERLRLYADIETLPPGSDVVLLSNGDRSVGDFERLDGAFVELKVARNTLKLDRGRVRALRLNPELTNRVGVKGVRSILTLNDESRITATRIELKDGLLNVNSIGLGNLVLPLAAVKSCQFFGGRIVPLVDYDPAKVEFTPYLSNRWSLTKNMNCLRGPLILRDTEFVTGLGMHSRMAVTYELKGNERQFQSAVGIDDASNGAGSAVFAVDLDGRRVWTSPNLTGQSEIANTPIISLNGSTRITLFVDFGQFADVSDYADWCNPVMILNRDR